MVTGRADFNVFGEQSECCNDIKKLLQCNTNNYFYVESDLIYNTNSISIGDVFNATLQTPNGEITQCFIYHSDVDGSPDSYVRRVNGVYSTCGICVSSNIPSQTPTPSNTVTPTVTASLSPTPSVTSSVTPSISLSPTPGVSQTATPRPTVTPSVTPTQTRTETPTPTPTHTPTVTQSITPSVTPTYTPTNSVTPTNTPTLTQTLSPSVTLTNTPTISLSDTPGVSQTPTPTISHTPDVTPTNTPTPSNTTPCCTNWTLYGGTQRGGEFSVIPCDGKPYSIFVNAYTVLDVCALLVELITDTDATVYPDASCQCVTPTPTPTQSQTPTPTYTPTQTPTQTQTPTPTNTLTPSVTASLTPSTSQGVPQQTHVYSACTSEIAIIVSQDIPVPSVTVGQTFQHQGVCYIYVGIFNKPYSPPSGFIYSNSSTNVFGTPTTYVDCETCNSNLNPVTPTPTTISCSLTVFNSGPTAHPSWSSAGVNNLNAYKTKIQSFDFYSPTISSYTEYQNTGAANNGFTVNGNITFAKSLTNNSLNSTTVDSTITVGDVYAVKMCANDLNNTVTWSIPSTSANQILTFEARDPQNQWLTGENFVLSATTNSTVTTENGKTFYYFEAECTSATSQVNASKTFTDNTNITWSGEFCLTQSTLGPQFLQWNVQRSVALNCPNCTIFGPLVSVYTSSSVTALANGVVVYNNSALTTYVNNGNYISDGSNIYSVGPNGVLTLECGVGSGC